MALLQQRLPYGTKIKESLGWIGAYAETAGNTAAADLCRELIRRHGNAELTVEVTVVDVLCQACDAMRAASNEEAVTLLEALIAALKKSDPPRVIVGTLHFHGNADRLDKDLAELRAKIHQR